LSNLKAVDKHAQPLAGGRPLAHVQQLELRRVGQRREVGVEGQFGAARVRHIAGVTIKKEQEGKLYFWLIYFIGFLD
jgi:hypothetical protein